MGSLTFIVCESVLQFIRDEREVGRGMAVEYELRD
jgi:hypothetical protein